MKRRTFLVAGGIVGGGFALGLGGLAYVNNKIKKYSGIGMGDGTSLNAWVRIHPSNSVTIAVARTEMGQGVHTSLPMLIAEELEFPLEKINVVHPQNEGPYANLFMAENQPRDIQSNLTLQQKIFAFIPNIITGGSTTIRDAYDQQRLVGAMAREMLISAAAKRWKVSRTSCRAETGFVILKSDNRRLSYGELAEAAAKEKLLKNPPLKPKKSFSIIGKSIQRLDVPGKVNGSAEFGLDVRIPGMKFAVIRHPSSLGGTISGISNQSKIEAMPGVEGVVLIEEGAVVVARTTWHAKNAAAAFELKEEDRQSMGETEVTKELWKALKGKSSKVWEDKGNINQILASADERITAEYELPYLAHACMEPMNCTVKVDGDSAEVWTGNQSSTFVVNGVSEGAGIDKDKIRIYITYLGGGFGRRGETDFVLRAAKVAKKFPGVPIQLVYTREEDMRNDYYRPAVTCKMEAAIKGKEVAGWKKRVVSQGALAGLFRRNIPMSMKPEDDPSSTEGLRDLPYSMSAAYTDLTILELPAQVGTWRSVGHSHNAFFSESFMDECSVQLAIDPMKYRISLLKDHPRHRAVLEKLAELSHWNDDLPEGKWQGVALHESFGSIVGEVAEIELDDKAIKVKRVYCVIDCGRVVNPAIIESQMQSGIVYGLTAALYGEITMKKGRIVQNNFPNYKMVRMNTMPLITTHIMDLDEYPGGVGEPGTPPIAPALTNAIFAANGHRIRSLPLSKHGYRFV